MKNKYLIAVLIVLAALTTYFVSTDSEEVIANQEVNLPDFPIQENKGLTESESSAMSSTLQSELAFPTNKELENSWTYEYSCDDEKPCEFPYAKASSFEDALWLKRRGYPTKSMLSVLEKYLVSELEELAVHGNVNAMKLLGIKAISEDNDRGVILYGLQALSKNPTRDTFSRYLKAQGHLMAERPALASIELRKASLLGDTNAQAQYLRLTEFSVASHVDNINSIAYNYLSQILQTGVNQWNSDPRPVDNGDG